MPKHFVSPIPASELNSQWLVGWDKAVNAVKKAISKDKVTTVDLDGDNDMTITTSLTEDDG